MMLSCARGRELHGTRDDPPGRPVKAATLLDAMHGWALTESRLASTDDGGKTWLDLTPIDIAGVELRAAYFIDTQHGWLVGESPPKKLRIYRFEGGEWRLSNADISGSSVSISFSDARNGWLTSPTVYGTTDGGSTWIPADSSRCRTTKDPCPLPTAKPVSDPVFASSRAWMLGSRAGRVVLYSGTRDGASWRAEHETTLRTPSDDQLIPLARAGEGFVAFQSGKLVTLTPCCMKTTPTGLPKAVETFSFADDRNGWAIAGAPAKLYATDDGGATWRVLEP